jgi:D-xylulose reductase
LRILIDEGVSQLKALVLEEKGKISYRDFDLQDELTPDDVRVKPMAVGICGSDVHYYREGNIGDFVVRSPMILGHEAAGEVIETGSNVSNFAVGDRVCMEPGIPDFRSSQTLMGMYNLDPSVRFWATPPVHGCLRETVVHPASLTFKLPENVSYREGALIEPVAIGVYSAKKAAIAPGDTALVLGAGTIGTVTALAAKASGCSKVFVADIKLAKLELLEAYYSGEIVTIDLGVSDVSSVLADHGLDGVDIVFEATGAAAAFKGIADYLVPGGRLVLIGMPDGEVGLDVVALQVKEISIETIFRYVNIFPKAIDLIASGKLNALPLITKSYPLKDAVEAFEYAATLPDDQIKIMIEM